MMMINLDGSGALKLLGQSSWLLPPCLRCLSSFTFNIIIIIYIIIIILIIIMAAASLLEVSITIIGTKTIALHKSMFIDLTRK